MSSDVEKRPHLVMVVGNAVVGDSRVEKSAQTAYDAGYRVTVLGVLKSTVQAFDFRGDASVFRAYSPYSRSALYRENAESATWLTDVFGKRTSPNKFRRDLTVTDYRAGRGRFTRAVPFVRPPLHQLVRILRRLAPRVRPVAQRVDEKLVQQVRRQIRLSSSNYRQQWPVIADFEEMFVRALVELEPDLIHCHDFVPLPGVDTYAAQMNALRNVPWLYDAHEWVPGVYPKGDVQEAWIAAEAETIQRADAVITVTDEIAHRLQKTHRLPNLPKVVANAPKLASVPMSSDDRLPLREECGIEPDAPLMVYVGGITVERGVLDCVRAMPLLPGAHLAFVCNQNADMRAQIRVLAEELGVSERVHIVDYVPVDSVTWYIKDATVGVCPLRPDVPQYHLAMATKIREYLLAGLPVLVSNMRTQAEFIKQWGVGEVFDSHQPPAIADAFTTMVNNIDRYRAQITDQLRRENSWEAQEAVLVDTWRSLCPPGSPRPAQVRPATPRLAISAKAFADPELVGRGWEAETGGSHRTFEPVKSPDRVQPHGLLAALDAWEAIGSDSCVVLGLEGVFDKMIGGLAADIRNIQAVGGRSVVWVEGGRFDSPQAIINQVPGHPYGERDDEAYATFNRQARHTRQLLEQLGVPILTSTRLSATQSRRAMWVPTPVTIGEPRTEFNRSVLILRALRTIDEDHALAELTEQLRDQGVRVDLQGTRQVGELTFSEHDVVIDALSLGEYSQPAAYAMAAGCVVVSGQNVFDETTPVVEAAPTTLVEVVTGLFADETTDSLRERSRASVEYARLVHDGRLTTAQLQRAFDIPRTSSLTHRRSSPAQKTLAIGPTNMAGQAWAWAKAIEARMPDVRTYVRAKDGGFGYGAHDKVPQDLFRDDLVLGMRIEQKALREWTHVLFENAQPLFGLGNGPYFRGDLPLLEAAGIKVGLIFHGSELRNPQAHADRVPWSPFADPTDVFTGKLQRRRDALMEQVESVDLPMFVSTPDLLDDLPQATWLPVTIDPTPWQDGPPALTRDRLKVLHLPSRASLKGTALIDDALIELDAEGLIEYVRPEQHVQNSEMPALVNDADIVLDQFALGAYGVAACEAMAAGRLVMAYLSDSFTARIPDQVAIWSVPPSEVGQALREIVADRSAAQELASRGPEYVERWHTGAAAVEVLRPFLES